MKSRLPIFILALCLTIAARAQAADKLVGIHSARVLSQSMPWIAQDAGLFAKHNLDFPMVFIPASSAVTAAMLGGDGEIALTGGEGMIRANLAGGSDFVFIGAVKNILTHSIMGKPELKRPEDLKGKKVGVTRLGGNPHYFAIQALRLKGLDPSKDVTFIQTGGAPETLAALKSGVIDAAALTAPTDTQATAMGYNFVIFGRSENPLCGNRFRDSSRCHCQAFRGSWSIHARDGGGVQDSPQRQRVRL
jgi:NitT/TauT family transport system substrate-binding protein